MPRVTAFSTDQPFTPSPESQRNGKDLPGYLAKVQKDKDDANRAMNIEPGVTVMVNTARGPVEAVFQNAYRWPSDPKVVVAIVTMRGNTVKIEASRIGPVIRTKGKK